MIIRAKFASQCGTCGRRIAKGDQIEWTRGLPAVHAGCATGTGRADGLVTVPGDNRLFARTRHGLRAGYESTGQRCIDAPCCGCCD